MVQVPAAPGRLFHATRLDYNDPWVTWSMDSIARTADEHMMLRPKVTVRCSTKSSPIAWNCKLSGSRTPYPACCQHALNEHLPVPLVREALSVMAGNHWHLGVSPPAHA